MAGKQVVFLTLTLPGVEGSYGAKHKSFVRDQGRFFSDAGVARMLGSSPVLCFNETAWREPEGSGAYEPWIHAHALALSGKGLLELGGRLSSKWRRITGCEDAKVHVVRASIDDDFSGVFEERSVGRPKSLASKVLGRYLSKGDTVTCIRSGYSLSASPWQSLDDETYLEVLQAYETRGPVVRHLYNSGTRPKAKTSRVEKARWQKVRDRERAGRSDAHLVRGVTLERNEYCVEDNSVFVVSESADLRIRESQQLAGREENLVHSRLAACDYLIRSRSLEPYVGEATDESLTWGELWERGDLVAPVAEELYAHQVMCARMDPTCPQYREPGRSVFCVTDEDIPVYVDEVDEKYSRLLDPEAHVSRVQRTYANVCRTFDWDGSELNRNVQKGSYLAPKLRGIRIWSQEELEKLAWGEPVDL